MIFFIAVFCLFVSLPLEFFRTMYVYCWILCHGMNTRSVVVLITPREAVWRGSTVVALEMCSEFER